MQDRFIFWLQILVFLEYLLIYVSYDRNFFLRLRRAMLVEAFEYLEHLHTASENFSRATFKKVFRQKATFSKVFIRIFWELNSFKYSIFSTFNWISLNLRVVSRTRRAMYVEDFRWLQRLHTTPEKFSRVTLKNFFSWKNTFSYNFVRIFWELNTLKNSFLSLLVAYLLIYASYDRHCFADA